MFRFQSEDFHDIADHPLFQQGVQILLDQSFNVTSPFIASPFVWFRGDPNLIEELKSVPRYQYSTYLRDYSLPYLSICEDPEYYRTKYGENHKYTINVQQDFETRSKLCQKATNRYDTAWWSYIHHCELVAAFLMYPFVKLHFPNLEIYLHDGVHHVVIIGVPCNMTKTEVIEFYKTHQTPEFFTKQTRDVTEPCVFDLISFTIEEDLSWIFEFSTYAFKDSCFINEKDIISWYLDSYGDDSQDEDILRFGYVCYSSSILSDLLPNHAFCLILTYI